MSIKNIFNGLNKNFNKAFTLSEVLITLGIIGVIAVLTIPAVVKDYRNKLYVSQLKKTFVQIEDAMYNIMADEHASFFSQTTAGASYSTGNDEFPGGKGAYYFLNNYFKTMKKSCSGAMATDSQCFSPTYASLNGEISTLILYGQYCVQLTSGATVCMLKETDNNIYISIDVNGPADPNIAGRDAFELKIDNNKLVDLSDDESLCGTKTSDIGRVGAYSAGCVTKIINDGWTMKY